MTCVGREEYVNYEGNKLSGIIKSTASYENGNAIVKFDNSKTNITEIGTAISGIGYPVTDKKEKQNGNKIAINNHLPQLRARKRRKNADKRLSIFLRM